MKRYIYTLAVTLPVLLAGCDKGLLNQTPKTELTTATALVTYANFQSYAWDLYDYFTGYSGNNNTTYPLPLFSQDCNSDNMAQTVIGDQSQYIQDTKIVPSTGTATAAMTISGWDFSYVRQVNVMLDAIDNSQLSASDKNHWRSVGYFFRALRYYDLIAAFGDVPWIEHTLNEDSTAELYGPRTSRDTVAQNILSDLEYADVNIGTGSPDGTNTINQACVDALISRFGLFEGTYRKYHGLDNANTYLQACATYSQKLLPEFPSCMSSYDDVYNSTDLTGQPGIILFKLYSAALEDDHEFGPRFMGSTSENIDMTKDAVESYLCADGKPISTSAVYNGNSTMFNEFRNRDHRLYFTVVPPYTVIVDNPDYDWSYTSNPADSEYVHLMDSLSPSNKRLPVVQWSQNMNTGTVISESPHFYLYNNGQSQAISQLGYFYWKQYNRLPLDANTYSVTACPLFRIEEVWLNYAEASFELGSFSQSVADETINLLRPRAGLPPMEVAGITAGFDTERDADVDPVLWEIRRERRVELMGDGFRFNDIKRWDKGTYLNKLQLGVYVNNANYGNKLSIYGGGQSGYVQFFPAPVGWQPQYYLEPIPTQELQLDKALVQNPGW